QGQPNSTAHHELGTYPRVAFPGRLPSRLAQPASRAPGRPAQSPLQLLLELSPTLVDQPMIFAPSLLVSFVLKFVDTLIDLLLVIFGFFFNLFEIWHGLWLPGRPNFQSPHSSPRNTVAREVDRETIPGSEGSDAATKMASWFTATV